MLFIQSFTLCLTPEHSDYRVGTCFSRIGCQLLPDIDKWWGQHATFLAWPQELPMSLFRPKAATKMTFAMDSCWPRWQWRVQDGTSQSPTETTPLLSPERETQSASLAQQRVVFPNNCVCQQDWEKISRSYSGNRICTTKYTLLTFLPQNLFEQFHRSISVCPNNARFNQVFPT